MEHRPAVIRVFLAQGCADGFRMIEKSNWTGLGLVCSRADYLHVRRREEWSRPKGAHLDCHHPVHYRRCLHLLGLWCDPERRTDPLRPVSGLRDPEEPAPLTTYPESAEAPANGHLTEHLNGLAEVCGTLRIVEVDGVRNVRVTVHLHEDTVVVAKQHIDGGMSSVEAISMAINESRRTMTDLQRRRAVTLIHSEGAR